MTNGKKYLSIVSTAYRATVEEQDDTVVWLCHALRGAGANVDIALDQAAANYAVVRQDASGLDIAGRRHPYPPDPVRDLTRFVEKGGRVFVLFDALATWSIRESDLIPGVHVVRSSDFAAMLDGYDTVWAW